jgi:hypothetical protein
MARKCVFCGAKETTREHVFEQEINTVLGVTGPVTMAKGAPYTAVRPPSATLDVVVRATCKPCNNKWLNGIWGRFRDLMAPAMLNTSSVTLSAQGQLDVSMWAVKTALLLEMAAKAMRGDAFLPMNHFTYLRDQGQPPPGTEVWLFRVQVANAMPAWHQAGVLRGGESSMGYIATFTVGYLGLQVLGRKIVEAGDGRIIFYGDPIEPPADLDGALQQIRPIERFYTAWPPALTIKASDLPVVARWPMVVWGR